MKSQYGRSIFHHTVRGGMARIFLAVMLAMAAVMWAADCGAVEQNRLRKINITREGDHLYVKMTGTTRFRYRVKAEDKPPRLTVQLFSTETELGYENLDVNQGYVKDLTIQEMTISGQRATFVVIHLSQSVEMDYGQSGDGRTLYLATPLFANASPAKSIPEYTAEPAYDNSISGNTGSNYTTIGGSNDSLPTVEAMPPEIIYPGDVGTAVAAPDSEFIAYTGAWADCPGGECMDFNEDVGLDNSPYIVGPVILQDADISKVVQLLSEAAGGASIIVESKVLEESAQAMSQSSEGGGGGGGGITMTLSHITLEDALDVITSANDWAWLKIANSYMIVSHETAMSGLKSVEAAEVYDVTSAKLPVTLYRPRYIDACTLKSFVQSTVPDSLCDMDTNYLLMKGRYEDVQRAKQILLEVDVPRKGGETPIIDQIGRNALDDTERFMVTHVLKLRYIRASKLQTQLQGLMESPYFGDLSIVNNSTSQTIKQQVEEKLDVLSIDEESNTLVFVGREEVFRRLREVIQQLDVPYSATIVRTIQLENAFVRDLGEELSDGIMDNLGRDDTEIMYNIYNNSVTFIGTEDDYERFSEIISSYDTDDKEILTESVFFNNVGVTEILQSTMLDPILTSAQYGYAEILTGQSSGGSQQGHTRITVHTPSNSFIISAQRRYMERIKHFLRSLDIDPQKVVTKVVKIRYLNAVRVILTLEQMLQIEDVDSSPANSSGDAPFFGNFYWCDQPWELQLTGNQVQYTYESCGYDKRFSVKTTPDIQNTHGKIHNLTAYMESAQNSIVLRGPERDVKKALDIIEAVDIPFPQVRIDIQIVEVNREDLKDFAKEFSYGQGKFSMDSINSGGVTSFLYNSEADVASQFISFISTLVQQKRASVLANPSIVTRENAFSSFSFTDIVRYQQPGSVVIPGVTGDDDQQLSTSTEGSVSIGPWMWLIPHINTVDNTVLLHMVPIYTSLTGISSQGLPQTGLHHMEQEVFVKSGETVISSGFITSQDLEVQQQVPILGSLPLIGNLFRSKSHQRTEKELIFMLTPTIMPIT